jgi:hypothetical protein
MCAIFRHKPNFNYLSESSTLEPLFGYHFRKAASAISRALLVERDLANAFGSITHLIVAQVIFSKTLRSVDLLYRPKGSTHPLLTYSVCLGGVQERLSREKILQSSGWEKQGLLQLFSSYV